MDFWRSEAYSKFFDHLNSKGGFYYEVRRYMPSSPRGFILTIGLTDLFCQQRWGDAPVHTIGAALFVRKDQIHFFDEIGYHHPPFQHCPRTVEVRREKNCNCMPTRSMGELASASYSHAMSIRG